jgi:prolyl oligopeptidase
VLAQPPVELLLEPQRRGRLTYDDPLRGLEEDSAAVLAWQSEVSAEALQWLESAELSHAKEFVDRYMPRDASTLPVRRGPVEFQLLDSCRVVSSRHEIFSTQGVIDFWSVSPQGSAVAVAVASDGREDSTLLFVATATGDVIGPGLPHAGGVEVAWLSESEVAVTVGAGARKRLVRCDLNTGADEQELDGLTLFALPEVAPDGSWLTVSQYVAGGSLRLTHARHLAPGSPWIRPVTGGIEPLHGFATSDGYIAVTREGAPRGRVVQIPWESGQEASSWRELVTESSDVLVSVRPTASGMLLESLRDTSGHLVHVGSNGSEAVPLPVPVTVHDVRVRGDEVDVLLSSPTSSPAIYRHRLGAVALTCVLPPALVLNADVRRVEAVAPDGARVPSWLVSPPSAELPRTPAVLHVYGGFNKPWLPRWEPLCAALVSSGVSYTRPSLRGGGELGGDWWHAGRGVHRARSFDDACVVAEQLGKTGLADPAAIGLYGASYGGIVAASAVARRPELFAVVVPSIGVYDLVRMDRDEIAALGLTWELGDPEVDEELELLAAASPYHQLRGPVTAPPTLVVCGEHDVRCPPWHSRKLAARLAQLSPNQVLLRVWPGIGHFTGAHREEQVMLLAEPLAFLLHHLRRQPSSGA